MNEEMRELLERRLNAAVEDVQFHVATGDLVVLSAYVDDDGQAHIDLGPKEEW